LNETRASGDDVRVDTAGRACVVAGSRAVAIFIAPVIDYDITTNLPRLAHCGLPDKNDCDTGDS